MNLDGYNLGLFNNFMEKMTEILPTVLGVIFYLIFCWFVVKILMYIIRKALLISRVRTFFDNINQELFKNPNSSFDLFQAVLVFVRFFLIFIMILIGTDLFGMTIASQELAKIILYLPKLFIGIAIFIVGVYLASHLRKNVAKFVSNAGFSGGKVVSKIVYGVLFVFITITALNQAGVDTDFITNNLSIIIGVIFITIALSMGLGSKKIVERILLVFYARRTFKIGDRIKIGEETGVISDIGNLSVTINVSGGKKIVIPIREISDNRIEILE